MSLSPRVLLVDDDTLLLRGLERGLKCDYDVTTVDKAADAEALLLGRNRYHIVVTDLAMPGIGGMEFLERVAPDHPDSRFIILSGHISQAVQRRADAIANVYDVLTKPIGVGRLVDIIRAAALSIDSRSPAAPLVKS